MPISPDTLFHYTSKLEYLENILTNEFKPRFCLENFNLYAGISEEIENLERAIPMVCFCHLPLSQVSSHMEMYGEYGIGLTREWGIRNGVVPILYTYTNSKIAERLGSIAAGIMRFADEDDAFYPLSNDLFALLCHMKPYQGDFKRGSEIHKSVRFYNEREWRYVPKIEGTDYQMGMEKESYLDAETRDEGNSWLAAEFVIPFEPNDVKYLIVSKESEIISLISWIEKTKRKYSVDEVKLLSSRVISAEQIRSDF